MSTNTKNTRFDCYENGVEIIDSNGETELIVVDWIRGLSHTAGETMVTLTNMPKVYPDADRELYNVLRAHLVREPKLD